MHAYPLNHHNDSHNSGDNDAKDTGTRPARSTLESLDVLLATSTSRNARAHSSRWAYDIAASSASGRGVGCLVGVLGNRDYRHGLDRNKSDGGGDLVGR